MNDQGQRRDRENFREAGTHRLGPQSALLGRGRVTACVIRGVSPPQAVTWAAWRGTFRDRYEHSRADQPHAVLPANVSVGDGRGRSTDVCESERGDYIRVEVARWLNDLSASPDIVNKIVLAVTTGLDLDDTLNLAS